MNDFEKQIGRTFQQYRDAKLAHVYFLYPPMRVASMHGHMPCYVPTGKAPYDAGGFYFDRCATTLGIELKETKEHENRLPIVGPNAKGNGLHYHQLEALVSVHGAGGIALLLWSNGGEIGRLDGAKLTLAKLQYDASLRAEAAKKEVAKGVRSILWGGFELVKYGHDDMPLWLPKSPPCERKSA